MTEGSSAARILYSDKDSTRMRRLRRFYFAAVVGAIAADAVVLGVLSVEMLASPRSDRTAVLRFVLALTAIEVIVIFLVSYTFGHAAWDALRRGFRVTTAALHFKGTTIPLASILRAEIVRFPGFPDYLAIDRRHRWLRWEWVSTTLIARKETEGLEGLRDAVRSAMGVFPQTLVTESTRREWQKTANALLRRPARP